MLSLKKHALHKSDLPLVGQALSSLRSAAGQDFAAIAVGHSLTETMLFLAMEFLRLIGSKHMKNLLSRYNLQFLIIA